MESWGRFPLVKHRSLRSHPHVDSLWPSDGLPLLAFGNGRSYGDVALNAEGHLLCMRAMNRFLVFDQATGRLRAEAGVLLSDVIERCLPRGWFPAVVPGTQSVTLGGAVANDVHGKNHTYAGTFGRHVTAIGLRRSDGSALSLRQGDASGLFEATIGGLGLTGAITWVEVQLQRVAGPLIRQTKQRLSGLDAYFERMQGAVSGHEYAVAWIDCVATGPRLGRGYLTVADHYTAKDQALPRQPRTLSVPFSPPVGLVNRASLRPLNALIYHSSPARAVESVVSFTPYLFPLDGIKHWNRLYGPNGFVQYQCVVPKEAARPAIAVLLREIARSGRGSMLAVLKEFGPLPSPGLLSFPLEGTTLALDFPNPDKALFGLFSRLDAIVAEAGGRLYAAKDACWPGARFRRAYPAWEQLEALRDPAFSSSLWRRVVE